MTTTPDTSQSAARGSDAATPTEAADYGVLRWLVAATFIVILNETVMVNAIPRLMVEFEVTELTAQWLTSAFLLTMAVVIPTTGWFLRRVTTRQAFGTAMSIFCAGTLLAALAPTFEVLLLARVVQAAGTAVMMPLLMTTVMTLVAVSDRGRIMGNVTLAMSVAPAMGPTLSGVVLEVASWRWMFGVVLPIAVLVTVVGLSRLTNVGETVSSHLDWPSVVLSALAFGPLVYGFAELGGQPDPAWVPWVFISVGLASLAAFVSRQLRLQRGGDPLLDLRVLRHRTFTLGLLLMSVAFMAFLGSLVLLPLYLQRVLELSELDSGLLVMPGGLTMGLLGPQFGKLFDRFGGRPLVIPGAVGVLVGLTLLTQVSATTSVWAIVPVHMVLMASLAAIFTPVFTLALGALPPTLYSHGSSMLGTLQQVSAAMGSAVVTAVLTVRQTALRDDGFGKVDALVGGMQWAFGVGAVLAVVVLVLAVLMPGRPDVAQQHAPAMH